VNLRPTWKKKAVRLHAENGKLAAKLAAKEQELSETLGLKNGSRCPRCHDTAPNANGCVS
jgi:hypothetical protein